MSEQPALECIAVTKTFAGGVRALRSVDVAVRSGETLAIIGASGCGKTTMLRLFNRMEEPTAGEVRIAGRPAADLDAIALRRRTGYVQQEGGLLPHWNVERNVGLVPKLLGWPTPRRAERTGALLAMVGLPPDRYRSRLPEQLSGGERQRVAFARALAADPDVVLLDEPFGALDALTRAELQDEFLRLRKELGKTMVVVTHDVGEAFRLADRVAAMREGRVLQIDVPQALERAPASDYVAALLERGLRR